MVEQHNQKLAEIARLYTPEDRERLKEEGRKATLKGREGVPPGHSSFGQKKRDIDRAHRIEVIRKRITEGKSQDLVENSVDMVAELATLDQDPAAAQRRAPCFDRSAEASYR